MNRKISRYRASRKVFFLPLVFLLLSSLTGCGLLRQPAKPPQSTITARVTADEIARAMQEDHFFSDYRLTTLVVQGTVASVEQKNNDRVVTLATNLPTKVLCDLGAQAFSGKEGAAITVQAPSSSAERAPSAVLLKDCKIASQ